MKDYLFEKVLTVEPKPQSRASLMLLCRQLAKRAVLHGFEKWLNFRRNFLAEKQKQGDLTCFYCSRSPLHIEANPRAADCATLDHVLATSKGGGKYDKNNLVVCCNVCNARKKNMSVEDFKKLLESESPRSVME